MARFAPGESGNPNGRPKGSKNVNTEALRAVVAELLADNVEKIKADFAALKPRERVAAWTALLEYSLPKLQRSEMAFNLDELNDEQMDALLRRALNIAHNGQENDAIEDFIGNGNY